MALSVPSDDPSSTNTISQRPNAFRIRSSVAAIGAILPASLWAGSTTEISGVGSLIDPTQTPPASRAVLTGGNGTGTHARPASRGEPSPRPTGIWHTTTAPQTRAWTREGRQQ